ncbi:hypothetical protein KUTeg_011518, partial [Tegillarca granosa]
MSSDEECEDDFIMLQPSWQSEKFKKYKAIQDNKYLDTCSTKSKRLMQKRRIITEHEKDCLQLSEDMIWNFKDGISVAELSNAFSFVIKLYDTWNKISTPLNVFFNSVRRMKRDKKSRQKQ